MTTAATPSHGDCPGQLTVSTTGPVSFPNSLLQIGIALVETGTLAWLPARTSRAGGRKNWLMDSEIVP